MCLYSRNLMIWQTSRFSMVRIQLQNNILYVKEDTKLAFVNYQLKPLYCFFWFYFDTFILRHSLQETSPQRPPHELQELLSNQSVFADFIEDGAKLVLLHLFCTKKKEKNIYCTNWIRMEIA